jgi:hypothetical protein
MEDDQDEEYFTALILSLDQDEVIANVLKKFIVSKNIDEAKLYLTNTENLRSKLQILVNSNSHQHKLCIEGLEIIEKVISNICGSPDDEKFRSINYDSNTLQKVLRLSSGLEFMKECGFEKIGNKLTLNIDKLNENNRTLLKWFNFIIEILKAKYLPQKQQVTPKQENLSNSRSNVTVNSSTNNNNEISDDTRK